MESTSTDNTNSQSISNPDKDLKKTLVVNNLTIKDFKSKLKIKTNLFTIEFVREIGETIFLYGVDVRQVCPKEEEITLVNLMRYARTKKEFHDELNKIFQSKVINGLILFGKVKPNEIIENFVLVLKEDKNKKVECFRIEDKNEVQEEEDKQIIVFSFTKKFCILDYEKKASETKDYSVMRNFLNICFGKLLKNCGYIKDNTTRKTIYYKNKDIEQNTLPLTDPKHKEYFAPFYFPGLKAICDIYEHDKILFKILPKNIVYSRESFENLYYYYRETYTDYNEEEIKKIYAETCLNKKAIKKYSGASTKIEDIKFGNPFEEYFVNKKGEKLSVGEYFNNLFNANLDTSTIPLAVRYVDKKGKIPREEAQQLIIPCRFLYVVGNLFEKRINVKYLVQNPITKFNNIITIKKEIEESRENLNNEYIENTIIRDLTAKEVQAYQLNHPIIEFKNESRYVEENGSFDMMNTKPYSGEANLNSIEVFLYGINQQDGQFLYNQLGEAGHSLGITITNNPFVETISSDLSKENLYEFLLNKMNALKESDKENKILITFLFLNYRFKDEYKYFKRAFNDSERKIPTQVILYNEKKDKGKDSNKLLSKFTNILCQVWGKRGDEIYKCDFSFVENTIVVAYSSMKLGTTKILTSLCISVNKKLCEYVFYSDITDKGEAVANYSINLQEILLNALKEIGKHYDKRKIVCKNIIIYRDGVNEKMIEFLQINEKQLILEALETANKAYNSVYSDAKICWIIASKVNDIKMFLEKENKIIENIPVGTIVDKEITNNHYYDFYLNSAFSGQGTNSSTHYTVLFDNTNLTANTIYKLTYFLTFLSFNTTKSIKIPAPLYFVTRRNNFTRDNLNGGKINHKVKLFNVTL